MELALVDACGGRFGDTHGSIHIYEVDEDTWQSHNGYSLDPDATLHVIEKLESEGKAEFKREIQPDDVVTV